MAGILVWGLTLGAIALAIHLIDVIPQKGKYVAYVFLGLVFVLALLGVLPGDPVLVMRN
jgi:hypothetical protein